MVHLFHIKFFSESEVTIMIPHKIHYCWFGKKPIPNTVKSCIDSWKRFCPDYEIIEWNEDNFDISQHPYMQEAYEAERWAFVSDLARLLIVYNNGGVYLDTDVELLKCLNPIVDSNDFYFAIEKDTNPVSNYESIHVATGLGFGGKAGHSILSTMIDEYSGVHFSLSNHTYDLTPCPVRNSLAAEKYGWDQKDNTQRIGDGTIYSSEFFCPKQFSSDVTRFTKNTFSVHHYDASWKTGKEKVVDSMKKILKGFKNWGGVFEK